MKIHALIPFMEQTPYSTGTIKSLSYSLSNNRSLNLHYRCMHFKDIIHSKRYSNPWLQNTFPFWNSVPVSGVRVLVTDYRGRGHSHTHRAVLRCHWSVQRPPGHCRIFSSKYIFEKGKKCSDGRLQWYNGTALIPWFAWNVELRYILFNGVDTDMLQMFNIFVGCM